jgi:hypothetical protein
MHGEGMELTAYINAAAYVPSSMVDSAWSFAAAVAALDMLARLA